MGVLWALLGSLGGSWGHLGGPRGRQKSKKLVSLIIVVIFKGSLGAARGSTGVPGWWFDALQRVTALRNRAVGFLMFLSNMYEKPV